MKAKKLTALILSILMIISVMPINTFAEPSAVEVADVALEEVSVPEESAELIAEAEPVKTKFVKVHSLDEIIPNQRYIIVGSYYNETTGETSYHAMGTQNFRNDGFRYSYAADQNGTHYMDISEDVEEITVYSYPAADHDPILKVRLRPYGYKFQGHAFYFRADNVENKGYLCGYSSSTSDGANGHHFHSSMPIYQYSYTTAGDAWWYVDLPEEGENEGHWQILSRCQFKIGGSYTYEYSVMKMGAPYPNSGGQFRTSEAYPLDVGEIEDDDRIQYIKQVKTNICLYREVCEHIDSDVTHTEAVSATCTKAGNTEYWYCAGCETYTSKEDFSDKISIADTFIAPTAHTASCGHLGEESYFELYTETSMSSDQAGERFLLVGISDGKYYAMGNVTNADGTRNAVEVSMNDRGVITANSMSSEFMVYDFDENGFMDEGNFISASDGKIITYAPEFASSGDYVPCSIRFSQDDYETGAGAFFAYSALDTANEYIVFDEENLVFRAQSEKVNNTYRYNELCKHENMYHSEAMDATCTEQGMKEFWYCEDCYCYFADEDGLASYGEVGDMESYFLDKATGHNFSEDDVCEYCGMKRHVYTQVSTLAEFDSLSEDASYIIVFKDADKTYAARLPKLEFICDIDSDGDGLADILEPDENENEIPDCIESYYSEYYGEEYDYDEDGDFDVDDYIAFIGDNDESGDFNDADLKTFLDWYHWDFHYPFEEEAKLSDNYTEVTLTDEGTITITDEGAMEFQMMKSGVWGGSSYDEEMFLIDLEYAGVDPETNRIRAAWVPNFWIGTNGELGYYSKGHIGTQERRLGDFERPGMMDMKNWKISFREDSTACIYSTWSDYDDTIGLQLVKYVNENEEADMTMVALSEWLWNDSPIMSTRTEQLPAYLFASEPVYVEEETSGEIDFGEKEDRENKLYVEINGDISEITSENGKYTFDFVEDELVEITEKDSDGKFVKSRYFFVDAENKTVKKLDMDSYLELNEKTSVRVKDPVGLRFKAHILRLPKFEETDFVIDEYGFVIATKSHLNGAELTLDTEKKVTGIAYKKTDGIDIVFDSTDDSKDIFTGILKNIPVKNYKTDLVCKVYTKITVNGKQFVVYSEPTVGNLYDSAKKLLETDPENEELKKIVGEYEKEVGIPMDDM